MLVCLRVCYVRACVYLRGPSYWLITGILYICAESTGHFVGARLQLKDDNVVAVMATFFFLAGRALASLVVSLNPCNAVLRTCKRCEWRCQQLASLVPLPCAPPSPRVCCPVL